MLNEIQNFIRLLARNPLTVSEVIAHSGEIQEDYGSNVLVRSRLPDFTEMNIVRRYGAEEIANVVFTLREPVPASTLEKRFGMSQRIAREERQPPQMIFYLPQPDMPCDIALIAALKGEMATDITLRRDPR